MRQLAVAINAGDTYCEDALGERCHFADSFEHARIKVWMCRAFRNRKVETEAGKLKRHSACYATEVKVEE